MNIKDIKALYKFLKSTDIVECEIEDERGRVKLKRAGGQAPSVVAAPGPEVFIPAQVSPAAPVSLAKESDSKEGLPSNIKVVPSPMVGIFYRAPSPEAPDFVEMGSQVNAGQVVCIIEAMKIMNEVETEFGGKVVAILVENGQPVEYGEPILHVEV